MAGCEGFDFCFGGRRQFCKSNYADLGELKMDFCCHFFVSLIHILQCIVVCNFSILGNVAL